MVNRMLYEIIKTALSASLGAIIDFAMFERDRRKDIGELKRSSNSENQINDFPLLKRTTTIIHKAFDECGIKDTTEVTYAAYLPRIKIVANHDSFLLEKPEEQNTHEEADTISLYLKSCLNTFAIAHSPS